MKRKLYLDVALLVLIFGGLGVLVFLQQQAPATETQTQEAAEQQEVVEQSAPGCCGASMVEGETPKVAPGGCCGTAASETPQSEDVDVVGCGCGS